MLHPKLIIYMLSLLSSRSTCSHWNITIELLTWYECLALVLQNKYLTIAQQKLRYLLTWTWHKTQFENSGQKMSARTYAMIMLSISNVEWLSIPCLILPNFFVGKIDYRWSIRRVKMMYKATYRNRHIADSECIEREHLVQRREYFARGNLHYCIDFRDLYINRNQSVCQVSGRLGQQQILLPNTNIILPKTRPCIVSISRPTKP